MSVDTGGRRALWIVAGGLALVLLTALLVRVVGVWFAGPLSLLGLLAVVVGGVFGIVAIVRRGERSILVFAALAVWLFWVLFLIGELVQPH